MSNYEDDLTDNSNNKNQNPMIDDHEQSPEIKPPEIKSIIIPFWAINPNVLFQREYILEFFHDFFTIKYQAFEADLPFCNCLKSLG